MARVKTMPKRPGEDVNPIGKKTAIEHFSPLGLSSGESSNAFNSETNLNLQNRFAIFEACKNGDLERVKELLGRDPSIIQSGDFLIHSAAAHGHLNVVQYLVEEAKQDAGAVDEKDRTPLWIAARHGNLSVFRYLRDRVNKNQADKYGRTPLWIAARYGHLDVVKDIKYRVDYLDQADKNGRTPLWIAARHGHLDVVRELIEANVELPVKANLNQEDKDGRTPLWVAACFGHYDVVHYLVGAGAEIDKADKEGRTPLWIATRNVRVMIGEFLFNAGANPNKADNDGMTPNQVKHLVANMPHTQDLLKHL